MKYRFIILLVLLSFYSSIKASDSLQSYAVKGLGPKPYDWAHIHDSLDRVWQHGKYAPIEEPADHSTYIILGTAAIICITIGIVILRKSKP